MSAAADPRARQAVYTEMHAEYLRRDLRRFVAAAWHLVEARPFKSNWHLDAICDHLSYVSIGDVRNLMINIPPRETKSLTVSVMWPVWWWTDDPTIQFMFSSYAHDLALRDAVKSRDILESAWYAERYGGMFYLDPTQNQKHRYVNNKHGYRISTSVGGKTTGEGGDVLGVDDPHNMTDVKSDPKRNSCLSWWDNSMRSRLNDPRTGQKVMIGQRSHDMDLFGHILATEGDRWTVLMLPREYDPVRHCRTYSNPKGLIQTVKYNEERTKKEPHHELFEDVRTKPKQLLNPQRFGAEEVRAERAAMSEADYEAQQNQDPEAGGGLILKRQWWRQWVWPKNHPKQDQVMPMPEFEEIFSVYDTAFKEGEENDYSARTTWGTFWFSPTGRQEDMALNAMLLERYNERVSFPDLKDEALRHQKGWDPTHTLIEDKASGQSLAQEFDAMGLSCWRVEPGPYDKIYKTHMVSPILRAGRIWYVPRTWAYEVISQCAKFPLSEYDDMHDTCVIAWAFMRRMGEIELPDDEKDNQIKLFARPKVKSPYG